ncbi:hypothetical protein CDAR_448281 [Caerostris darwini]|uniref:Uncharacterized protein n=1 Tax=Caerostris darwini TaxID=1538125 RepID=A0AAV4SFI8_9ARAC|nr:hypothetical protein CDAR_448281 [Caerostris darwini]
MEPSHIETELILSKLSSFPRISKGPPFLVNLLELRLLFDCIQFSGFATPLNDGNTRRQQFKYSQSAFYCNAAAAIPAAVAYIDCCRNERSNYSVNSDLELNLCYWPSSEYSS